MLLLVLRFTAFCGFSQLHHVVCYINCHGGFFSLKEKEYSFKDVSAQILDQGGNLWPLWMIIVEELVTSDTYSAVLRSVSRHFNPYSHLPRVTSVAKMIVEWGKFPNEAVHFGPSDSKTSARVMNHLQRVSLSGKTRGFYVCLPFPLTWFFSFLSPHRRSGGKMLPWVIRRGPLSDSLFWVSSSSRVFNGWKYGRSSSDRYTSHGGN